MFINKYYIWNSLIRCVNLYFQEFIMYKITFFKLLKINKKVLLTVQYKTFVLAIQKQDAHKI